jgi:Domain of unknown function (DUF4357)
MAGATIKIFLPNGEAESLRVAEISNWTGKAIAAPRSELDQLLARDEMSQSGIYFLLGRDPDTNKQLAYIGEAEIVRDRIRQHRDKEFWVQMILFVSKDENLTKSHIRYLEGRLIEEANSIGRFKIQNGQNSGSRLPESDREDMEVFLVRVRQLLPILGCDILIPLVKAEKTKIANTVLTFNIKRLVAMGQRTPSGFVVFKNSEATLDLRPSAPPWVIKMRHDLGEADILKETEGKLIFASDAEFSSPSAAAAVVCGGHVNGLTAWRNSKGQDLKELESTV